jgi:DNA-binding response OmpR family regulator/class 3 adenylate cyclase
MLQSAGYAVELAESQKRALELASGRQIKAAIVIDLPSLAQELRDKVPGTLVLGHTDERRSRSLEGSDVLPVQALDEQKLLEQLGRLTASPESAGSATAPASVLRIKNCMLDLPGRTFVDGDGREVQLTRCETALMAAFVASPSRVLSRHQLRHAVVGHGAEPYDRNVDMLVARLRRKIEPDSKTPAFILTVPGLGYKFAAWPKNAENDKSLPGIDPESQTEARATWVNRSALDVNRSALDRVKPTTLADQVGSTYSDPARRQVTVLSCRLVGALALASNLDLEDFGSAVRHFQGICTSVISKWGGTVIRPLADEILAFFGYPTIHENDAERAVHAGLDLVAKIKEILSPSGEPLQARIAIATSLIVVKDNQPAIEKAIVTATRLLKATSANSVIISSSTRELLNGRFACDDPQLSELQGASKPVTTYRVTGKRAIESRYEARSGAKQTRFVGRQYELQQMPPLRGRSKSGANRASWDCPFVVNSDTGTNAHANRR